MKTAIATFLAVLVSSASYAQSDDQATLICESEGTSLKMTVDKNSQTLSLHAWLTLDASTEKFEYTDLDRNFLTNARGGLSWQIKLYKDPMNTLDVSYDHYSDELKYEYTHFQSVETNVFSMEKSCIGWNSTTK